MESIEFVNVKPVKTVAPYLGGKSRLAKKIISHIDTVPHTTFVDVFAGMGGVFFRRDKKPKCEIINDINGEITNLFRMLQRHHRPLIDLFKFQIASRQEFKRLVNTDPATLTELERAARFLYLQRLAFGGKVSGQNFGVEATRGSRLNLNSIEPILEAAHKRLSDTVIESLPYIEILNRYGKPGTLFYLDPPYWNGEDDYGKGIFERADFERISDALRETKARFILSINDRPEIRTLFCEFDIEPMSLSYSISREGATQAKELIISN